jgi:tRNA pseudouridine38-40 synthase
LYNMVRNIAGALCEVGVGRFGYRWIQTVLESRERDSSSQTAPPQGLCLVKVNYPDSLFLTN